MEDLEHPKAYFLPFVRTRGQTTLSCPLFATFSSSLVSSASTAKAHRRRDTYRAFNRQLRLSTRHSSFSRPPRLFAFLHGRVFALIADAHSTPRRLEVAGALGRLQPEALP
ncbi:hypothetical protein MSAN_00442100 [Mycena sanguinolenta]|uniref:Uncharacterized protein n=1 Tax=Mycena sanguinolenta TaxID=230812 RepID=A0A8H6ZDL0_9AGAR|nr:hypothetical protein MSAN_00442100 [Mycena sanguinolenta]